MHFLIVKEILESLRFLQAIFCGSETVIWFLQLFVGEFNYVFNLCVGYFLKFVILVSNFYVLQQFEIEIANDKRNFKPKSSVRCQKGTIFLNNLKKQTFPDLLCNTEYKNINLKANVRFQKISQICYVF
eukprot:TRINITY_DN26533_c0_g1_i7.p7 TRINITY_DN26533_c0_g1~~TRINITY_DN26533_c0_g1_i7.p7  ORF type:complete len:129 (-),score=9.18 TRINITY_DN26533_c0_g1_i7:942-1328(-)